MFIPPAVIDTNVFVGAAFNPSSHSARITDALHRGELVLVWNRATRSETLRILAQIPPVDEQPFAELFGESGHYTGATSPGRFEAIPDPEDRKFAALADATGTVVVSSDSDLTGVRDRLDIVVRTPSEFVEHSGVFDL